MPEAIIEQEQQRLLEDLKNKKDTLSKINEIIKSSKFVGTVIFDKNDIVRSEVVKELLGMIEEFEDKNI